MLDRKLHDCALNITCCNSKNLSSYVKSVIKSSFPK